MTDCRARSGDVHSARPLNHAYGCSNTGYRTLTHTMVINNLIKILYKNGHTSMREPLVSKINERSAKYADIVCPSLKILIDVSGVITTPQDTSLHEAMEKRYNEKKVMYNRLSQEGKLAEKYVHFNIIPFVFGPRGQIYKPSQDSILKRLDISSISDNHRIKDKDKNKASSSSSSSFNEALTPQEKTIERTMTKSIQVTKYLWKRMQMKISVSTCWNALAWCGSQANMHSVDITEYHKPSIPLAPTF